MKNTNKFQNGIELASEKKDEIVKHDLDVKLNELYIARPSDNHAMYSFRRSPIPQISDFNIWSKVLLKDEMKDWTSCK